MAKLAAAGILPFSAIGLRLVKLGDFHLDAYLGGDLLMYHHIDALGLIKLLRDDRLNTTSTSLTWRLVGKFLAARRSLRFGGQRSFRSGGAGGIENHAR